MHTNTIFLVLILALSLSTAQKTIYEIIHSEPQYQKFANATSGFTELEKILNGTSFYSVFVPSQEAWLGTNQTIGLNDILYHIIAIGIFNESILVSPRVFPTLLTNQYGHQYVKLSLSSGGNLLVNEVNVTNSTLASNGVVYDIDSFLSLPSDILKTLSRFPEFSKLYSVLENSDIHLPENRTITLFAPLDRAFEDLPYNISEDPTQLDQLFSWHLSPEIVYSTNITDGLTEIRTFASLSLNFTLNGDNIFVNNSQLIMEYQDILTESGVIHGISKFVLPPLPSLLSALNLTSLLSAIVSQDLLSILQSGNFTLFAPTDEAFENAKIDNTTDIKSTLLYHVVPGIHPLTDSKTLIFNTSLQLTMSNKPQVLLFYQNQINNASILNKNQLGNQIIVHVIDKVLNVPNSMFTTISDRTYLSGLLPILRASGLIIDLDAADLTLFAPTSQNLNSLPYGYSALLSNATNSVSQAKAKSLLQNHVVSGVYYSTDIPSNNSVELTALSGETLLVMNNENDITVNGISISLPNIITNNGVIHSINGILFPNNFEVTVLELLPFLNCQQFASYIEKSGLTDAVSAGNITIFVVEDSHLNTESVGERLGEVSTFRSLIIPQYLTVIESNKRYHTLEDKISIRGGTGGSVYLDYEESDRTSAKILYQTHAYPAQRGSIFILDKLLLNEEHHTLSPGVIAAIVIVVIVLIVIIVGFLIWRSRRKVPYETVRS